MAADPFRQIRATGTWTLHGPNYWSRSPVTRLDLAVGAFDEISSAMVPEFTDRMLAALPGLQSHHCSYGEPGGFVRRLREGTYAPHIVEHVALELQNAVGHDVGYGRARGGDRPGEYTVVVAHSHAAVGIRALERALFLVQQALAGCSVATGPIIDELHALAAEPYAPPPLPPVGCAVTGGTGRKGLRTRLQALIPDAGAVMEVSPGHILRAGLPYSRSRLAVVLDSRIEDVPTRYRDGDRAARLLSVVADAVPPDGAVVVPADARSLHERILEADRRIAVFSTGTPPDPEVFVDCAATATVERGVVLVNLDETLHRVPLTGRFPVEVEAASALAARLMETMT